MRFPLPERLRASAESRAGSPSVPRDAATIALVRQGTAGIETYLLRRQSTMAFAAGMYVFPGGGVAEGDSEPVPWIGPSPAVWGERFRCAPELAAALVIAAVRETFEESGILLAGPDAGTVVADVSSEAFQTARIELDAGRLSFASFLAEHGLSLRADLVGAWAHWITPEFEPRRYDTRFLVAVVPDGQRVGSLPGEADRAVWLPVREALDAAASGEVAMMPPTIQTCRDIVELSVDQVLPAAAARQIDTVLPRLVEIDGELYIENPLEES